MRNRLILWLSLYLFCAASQAFGEAKFLKPDEAYRVTATQAGERIQVSWEIADGYYLYRSKFKFRSDTPDVELGNAEYPPTETKNDQFFGEVEIYRDAVTIGLPILAHAGRETLTLEVTSQGCADAGLCYPPHRQTLLVALDDAAAAPPPVADTPPAIPPEPAGSASKAPPVDDKADALAELDALAQDIGLGGFDDGILPVEQAFQFDASVEGGDTLHLLWQIADGTYLYADKIEIGLEGSGVELGTYELPKPKIKHDAVTPEGEIGDLEVYVEQIDFTIPLARTSADTTTAILTARYQGCAERGICYPPQTAKVELEIPATSGASISTAEPASTGKPSAADTSPTTKNAAAPEPETAGEPVAEQDQIASFLAGGSALAVIGTFFLIGLGLSFTPCVFPMIPILSGIITGQGRHITPAKGFTLSLVYVLAMAVTYTVAGVIFALSGENLQAALQNPWMLAIFAGIFVLLALSMFGFYDLQLPSSVQSKLTDISNRQQGGSLSGVAVMGFLSALIVGPCVAPPLAGALIYIAQSGDAFLGGTALFAMSMGMGAPLIVIGTSAGKLLPRAGAWMDAVKAVFGVVMLGVAIYLLERVLPESVSMLLWGMLLIVSGVYMGALLTLPQDASGWRKLWKGLGTVMLVYGALMLVGAAAGGRDTLQPLKGLAMVGGATQAAHLEFTRIKTVDDLDRAIADANAAGKTVMLDFYADWCVYCKQMEKNTFPEPAVLQALANTVTLQADVTANDEADKALLGRFDIPAPPAILFFGSDGNERRNYRLLGYMGPDEFAEHVRSAVR